MKKLLIITISFAALAFTGCLKDQFGTDVYSAGIKPIIEFEYPQGANYSGLGSGLEFFGGGNLLYPASDVSDTATFIVNIASTNTLGKAISITVGPDANALLDNYSNDSIKYAAMPDSDYTIINATQSIAAGQRQATFQVVFYPDKFDITQNFMLAMTITSASGYTVSGNFGHIYFHTIGNPLAGTYSDIYSRWNTNSTAGAPELQETISAIFLPNNPTEIEVQSGYGAQNSFKARYVLDFTATAGVLSNFGVAIDPNDVAGSFSPSGITLTVPASIILADPTNYHFKFSFGVTNGSGAPRVFTDEYQK